MSVFQTIAKELSPQCLWRIYRSLLLHTHSPLSDSQLQFCLNALVGSPQFTFSLKYLQLALNTDHTTLAYSLLMQHQEAILTQMEGSEGEREQLRIALSESMGNGLSLELKLRIAKLLLPLATSSFAQSLCSSEVPLSLSPNPIKLCLLFDELLSLLKLKFSTLSASLSRKQHHISILCGLFLEEVDSDHLPRLLHDRDLEGRQAIDLLKEHPQLILKIETFVQREWQGPLDLFSLHTFSLSTLFTLTSSSPSSVLLLKRGYWHRFKHVSTPLQFSFFRRSPLLKYIQYSLVIATIAVMLTVVWFRSLKAIRTIKTSPNLTP